MKKGLKSLLSLAVVTTFFGICFFTAANNLNSLESASAENQSINGQLIVHYLDVGQGDSEFIELPNGECMLIDASTDVYGNTVIDFIEELGYDYIDYVVATHPHDDHIGALDNVIEHFDIGEFYLPNVSESSKCYDDLITAVNKKNIDIMTAEKGVKLCSSSSLLVEFLSPVEEAYSETNNYSAVIKIKYKDDSFMFMGDAEKLVENQLEANYGDYIDVDVLKVGHHGSTNSSSADFLSVVTPRYAVISCGEDNPYDHPNDDAVERLKNSGAEIYCTDECSTITVTCNGNGNFDLTY